MQLIKKGHVSFVFFMKLYDQFYAWCQNRWKDSEVYPPTDKFKKQHILTLTGKVLEIGPGGGSNFRYLPKNIHWIGIEPNAQINKVLRNEAQKHGITNIELYNASGEQIPILENSCDAVMVTFVLCSVRDQAKVLSEIMRVLKPGGKFIFIEHVAASRGTILRLYQNLTNNFHRLWAKNCHVNRDTLAAITAAGFVDISSEHENIKMLGISVPHIRGVGFKFK